MSQNVSLDEVMCRIRARVEERNAPSFESPGSASCHPQTRWPIAVEPEEFLSPPRFEVHRNDLEPIQAEIATALEGTRKVGQINPRNPGLHNVAVQFVKKVMRRSLTWYTRPLHYFHGGAIRALQRMTDVLANQEQSLQRISEELNRHAAMISSLHRSFELAAQANSDNVNRLATEHTRDIAALDGRIGALSESSRRIGEVHVDLKTELEQMRTSQMHQITEVADEVARLRSLLDQIGDSFLRSQLQGRLRDRDFRQFVHDIRSGSVGRNSEKGHGTMVGPIFPSEIQGKSEFDYFAFEDLYRGDESLVLRQQEAYLNYFQGRDNVLDVGCGRGEFLELLRDNHISAKGVELGADQYLLCKEKGLDVVQQDLFLYLESLADESLGGLFSAQVMEHLTASDQLRYVTLAYQKTKPGSPVIFETINAQCVWAVVRNFFLDPTHIRPVHPETLKFAMESANFRNVALLFSSPLSERHIPPLELQGETRNLQQFNQQIRNLNDLLYGNQDYAAIGWH